MLKVLFLCVHNSARSQIAEAYLRIFGGIGLRGRERRLGARVFQSYVVRALAEEGIDIAGKETRKFDLVSAGRSFDYVDGLLQEEAYEALPDIPGKAAVRLHWPFDDPSTFKGSDEEILARVRLVRDAIKASVLEFVDLAGK